MRDAPRDDPRASGRHQVRRGPSPGRRKIILRALSVLVASAAAGVVVLVVRDDSSGRPVAGRSAPGSSVATARAPAPRTARTTLQVPIDPPATAAAPGRPIRVTVPRLHIVSPLEPLGLAKDGSLDAPSHYGRAGWYDRGARPGEVGPALIAGHVDSVSGPAVFFYLYTVRLGDDIEVTDDVGTVRHFTVTDIHRYHKSSFPSLTVYGPTPEPVLRLVTCTGAFDVRKHSYVDNLVVSATLNQPRAG